ncbi:unnamed protein product [Notodromas monacha]|uniref:rRNA-processing protein UTP23 homolog n=1 Tax=Notodromas monacha TaxID=399045 RepID=A0A7R9BZ06_9CRUS|nr:unnamed protein product [Notodromas monacha]CAG0924349.1 unnamed protein product [Notodromas monacha]
MKISRHKRTQRILSFYANNFGFREPHQVLVDGTFCQQALKNKVKIVDQIPTFLGGRVEILTTSCVVAEAEQLLPMTYGAFSILKQFPARKCGHKEPIGGAQCLFTMFKLGNPHHYFVATQDKELQSKAHNRPPVPVIYLHGATPTLEKPSEKCERKVNSQLSEKINVGEKESELLEVLKEELGVSEPAKKKRKRKGGPNPLSCKKPKVDRKDGEDANQGSELPTKKKRKRKRVKIPKHVKEALKDPGL